MRFRNALAAGAVGFIAVGFVGPAPSRADAMAPAVVVAETRLGPPAGNGTQPAAATVDTRRSRLWVLNSAPLSFSVVDLSTKRVLGVVPLSASDLPAFAGWETSPPEVWVGYDARADCILVCIGNSSAPSALVAVDAGTHHVLAARNFPGRLFYRCAFSTKRSEICVAEMAMASGVPWNLLIVDARTLQTRTDLPVGRRIEAMAASERTGRLYTVQPSHPQPPWNPYGPYSATRVIARDAATGAPVAQSRDEYPYPQALFVDEAAQRLYLVHGHTREDDLRSSFGISTTVSVLVASTLTRQQRLRYAAPRSEQAPLLPLSPPLFDAPRHRLLVSAYGRSFALSLSSSKRAIRESQQGPACPGAMATVVPATGQIVTLNGSATRLLAARTLQPGPSILLGAAIYRLFLDRTKHRLLAYVERPTGEFLMLENGVARRLFKASPAYNARLLAVDFDSERIYGAEVDSRGRGAQLLITDFRGRTVPGEEADGDYHSLLLTADSSRSFRLLFPAAPENVFALPRRSLDRLENGREVKSVPIPQSPTMQSPSLALYAAEADRVYIVTDNILTTYSGADLSVVGALSLAPLLDEEARRHNVFLGGLAVDDAGEFAYYADPAQKQIVKLSLKDGSVVARCRLAFTPSLPLVDSSAHRLYLADNDGGRIVALRLF